MTKNIPERAESWATELVGNIVGHEGDVPSMISV